MKRSAKYWQDYRRIRASVNSHLSAIVSANSSEVLCDYIQNPSQSNDDNHSNFDIHSNSSGEQSNVTDCFENVENNLLEQEGDGTLENIECEGSVHSSDSDLSDIDDSESHLSFVSDVSESSVVDDLELAFELCTWANKYSIPHVALKDLLMKLRLYHPSLPKDPRTLLKTKTNYEIVEVGGGSYYHFGIKDSLLSEIRSSSIVCLEEIQNIKLQLNIDGLPLFKSSSLQFWPILGRTIHPNISKPFIIGIFLGASKPSNINNYLQALVAEISLLNNSGLQVPDTNHHIQFEISCVICDTPARSFVKQVKGHSGYYGCDKCIQKGHYTHHRMTFPEVDAALRTDVQFDEMVNVAHHTGQSPLAVLPLGMVSQFPIDYMHAVCLGVMKRLLVLWTKGRTGQGTIFNLRVSDRLVNMHSFMPREFLRKGRSLYEMDRWKATEFRTFLVYTGPVVMKGLLPKALYDHFKLLFVAVYCLSSSFFCQPYLEFSHQLLVTFVRMFGQLYGNEQYVYNVHSLVHLADDVSRFGNLDNYSSFPFESYLGKMKKLVRNPNCPLQQVIRRISEKQNTQRNVLPIVPNYGIVKKKHNRGPRLIDYVNYEQYEEISLPYFFISVHRGDNCILAGEKVGLIRNILSINEQSADRVFVVQWFRGIPCCFYTEPLNSTDLRIFKVSHLQEDTAALALQDITCKCVLIPHKEQFVAIPLIHSIDSMGILD